MTYSNIEGGAPLETARVLLQHRLNLLLQKLVNLHAGKDWCQSQTNLAAFVCHLTALFANPTSNLGSILPALEPDRRTCRGRGDCRAPPRSVRSRDRPWCAQSDRCHRPSSSQCRLRPEMGAVIYENVSWSFSKSDQPATELGSSRGIPACRPRSSSPSPWWCSP